jgi:hypothetical protein
MTRNQHTELSKLYRAVQKAYVGWSETAADEHLIHLKKLGKAFADIADYHEEISDNLELTGSDPHRGNNPADRQQAHGSSPVVTVSRVAKTEYSRMESGEFPPSL